MLTIVIFVLLGLVVGVLIRGKSNDPLTIAAVKAKNGNRDKELI
jgi:hypothetical protein